MLALARALFSLFLATLIWHAADVGMLREFELGNTRRGLAWMSLHIVSIPFFAYSAYTFFSYQRSWWIVEFPYMFLSILISAFLFGSVLKVSLSWREAVAAMLLIAAGYLLIGKS